MSTIGTDYRVAKPPRRLNIKKSYTPPKITTQGYQDRGSLSAIGTADDFGERGLVHVEDASHSLDRARHGDHFRRCLRCNDRFSTRLRRERELLSPNPDCWRGRRLAVESKPRYYWFLGQPTIFGDDEHVDDENAYRGLGPDRRRDRRGRSRHRASFAARICGAGELLSPYSPLLGRPALGNCLKAMVLLDVFGTTDDLLGMMNMSTMKMLLIAWFLIGAATVGAVYATTLLSQPAYAAANC